MSILGNPLTAFQMQQAERQARPSLGDRFSAALSDVGAFQQLGHQNALRNHYAEHGPALVAGRSSSDYGAALSGLSRLDPGGALGFQERDNAQLAAEQQAAEAEMARHMGQAGHLLMAASKNPAIIPKIQPRLLELGFDEEDVRNLSPETIPMELGELMNMVGEFDQTLMGEFLYGDQEAQSKYGEIFADVRSGMLTPDQGQTAFQHATQPRGPLVQVGGGPAPAISPSQTVEGAAKGYRWAVDPSDPTQWARDENGQPYQEVIPRGPVAAENAAQAAKQHGRNVTKFESGSIILDEIDQALGLIKDDKWFSTSTGAAYWALEDVPKTDARLMRNAVGTIKAIVGFDEIQYMRENSPTGGALGQVSNFEIEQVQSLKGKIDPAAGAEELRRQLVRLRQVVVDRNKRILNSYKIDANAEGAEVANERLQQLKTIGLWQGAVPPLPRQQVFDALMRRSGMTPERAADIMLDMGYVAGGPL